MAGRYPQLDREFIAPLWHRRDGVELVPREELEALIDEHKVDPELLADALQLALVTWRRIGDAGARTGLREEVKALIERRAGPG